MNPSLLWFAPIGIVLSLAGCTTDGSQTGDENTGPDCEVVATTSLSEDEASPSGFAASEILSFAEGERARPLTWMDEGGPSYGPEHGLSTVYLNVSVTEPSSARWVDLELARERTQNVLITCPDRLEMDVDLSVSTEGGALNERLVATLIAHQDNEAEIDALLPLDAIAGSLLVDIPSGSEGTLRVLVGFDAVETRGQLRLVVEGQTDDSLSFQDARIANW